MAASTCPFCETVTETDPCSGCGRTITAPRRPCPRCSKMSPTTERTCVHCGHTFAGELSWKVPLIIAIFVVATALGIVVRLIAG